MQNTPGTQTPYYFTQDEFNAALLQGHYERSTKALSHFPLESWPRIIREMAILTSGQINAAKQLGNPSHNDVGIGLQILGLRLKAVLNKPGVGLPVELKDLKNYDSTLPTMGASLLYEGVRTGIVCPGHSLKSSSVYKTPTDQTPTFHAPPYRGITEY